MRWQAIYSFLGCAEEMSLLSVTSLQPVRVGLGAVNADRGVQACPSVVRGDDACHSRRRTRV